jgi:hypothetical protein
LAVFQADFGKAGFRMNAAKFTSSWYSISTHSVLYCLSGLQVEFGKVGFRTNRKLSKVVPDHLEGMSKNIKVSLEL